ncbi:MAG: acyl--CoA ligase [Actinobacteria bacterium]|nr:MAG: acyl--CoA ligase [Actinomycetota bacterium]
MSQRPTPVMTIEDAYARLTAPGAPFEIVDQEVLGEQVQVIKNRPPHLRHWLEKSADFGDRECWVFDDGRALTYREHIRAVASVAYALRTRFGIGKGDRVGVLGANSLEWVLSFWATTSLGAVTCAMNGWWQPDEIVYGRELTKPKVLIVDEKRYQRIADRPIDVPVVVIERDFADLLWDPTLDVELPTDPIDEDDAVAILFTSGTTGRPKGAISTHRNLIGFVQISTLSGAARALQFPPPANASASASTQTTNVVSAPLFHVSGLQSAAISGIAHGIRYIWTTGRFDPKQILEITAREKITRMGGITTQVWRILEHPDFDQYDLSHVTAMGGGGSVFSPELQRAMRDKLPNAAANFSIGYGLTECGGLCTMANSEMLEAHPDCVGKAIPTSQIAIFDDSGKRLPTGEVGNVCIKGPMVMPGYWDNPDATADAFFPGRWLKSGDFGWLDDDNLLFLATRKRDMIIRGGENIYPIEIENRLDEHPDVAEAAVVGVDHRTLGQQVKAIVVPRPGATITAKEVTDWVGASLAYYKVPEFVEIRNEPLPRNATGKVMKHVLTGEAENTMIEE